MSSYTVSVKLPKPIRDLRAFTRSLPEWAVESIVSLMLCGGADSGSATVNFVFDAVGEAAAHDKAHALAAAWAAGLGLPVDEATVTVHSARSLVGATPTR